jgi:hypothetical protein
MKAYLALLVVLGWFTLIAQFVVNITSVIAPPAELVIRYFSYFTIDSNLMVAVYCTVLLFKPKSNWRSFLPGKLQVLP